LRLIAGRFRRLLRRFLRRLFLGLDSSVEMFIRQLQIVLGGYRLAIADPAADDVHWEAFCKLSLSRAAKVLEQLLPRLQPGALDDPLQLRPKVGAPFAVSRDDVLAARLEFAARLMCLRKEGIILRRSAQDALIITRFCHKC
jgi:hypothetical protein